MAAMKILAISVACLLIGAGTLAAVISGPVYALAAPIVALFGWYFIFPILVLVTSMWALYGFIRRSTLRRVLYIASGFLIGGGFFVLLAAMSKRNDHEMYWGLVIGGALAGGFATSMITLLRKYDTSPGRLGR